MPPYSIDFEDDAEIYSSTEIYRTIQPIGYFLMLIGGMIAIYLEYRRQLRIFSIKQYQDFENERHMENPYYPECTDHERDNLLKRISSLNEAPPPYYFDVNATKTTAA